MNKIAYLLIALAISGCNKDQIITANNQIKSEIKKNQEVIFNTSNKGFGLKINENGNGIAYIGGGTEKILTQQIKNFNLLTTQESLEEFMSYPPNANSLILDHEGNGQFFVVKSGNPSEIGISPGIMIHQTQPLEIYVQAIKSFKKENTPSILKFNETYTTISLDNSVINQDGNGYIILRLGKEISSETTKLGNGNQATSQNLKFSFVLIPVKAFKLDKSLENLNFSKYFENNNNHLWLNNQKNGALLYEDGKKWIFQKIQNGALIDQKDELEINAPNFVTEAKINSEGNGYLYFKSDNKALNLYPIKEFTLQKHLTKTLKLETEENEIILDAYNNDKIVFVEVPINQSKGAFWRFFITQIDKEKSFKKEISYQAKDTEIFGRSSALSLNSNGTGIFAWTILDVIETRSKIHLEVVDLKGELSLP